MLDFPASPTVGQQFSSGTTAWIWDGTAWNIIPQMGPAVVSDTPPPNPAIGQFWWRSTNSQLYIWVDDGNSKQWVQAAGYPQTPNQLWEPIGDYTLAAQSQYDVPNLGAFRKLRVHGALAFSAAGALAIRVSSDNGATFYGGATDYSYQYMLANATTVVASNGQSTFWLLSSGGSDAGATMHFNTQIENFNVLNGDKGGLNDVKGRNSGSLSRACYGNAINRTEAMNAIRILPNAAGTITGKFTVEGMRG